MSSLFRMQVQVHHTPRSAGLPVTRNMPYTTASFPNQAHPRNMTGIYLGLAGNLNPPRPKSSVPPLARNRGPSKIRTPTEEQRFESPDASEDLYNVKRQDGDAALHGTSTAAAINSVRSSTWPRDSRSSEQDAYRKVELLRIKEEKRGFTGNPVKRHPQPPADEHTYLGGRGVISAGGRQGEVTSLNHWAVGRCSSGVTVDSSASRRWGPGKRIDPANLDELIRPNSRNFTTVSNSGVTRSEKLTVWPGRMPHTAREEELRSEVGVAREIDRLSCEDMSGLEECFRRVCKGNLEALHSLLPARKPQTVKREHTGFTVRSYRNPNQAEILAEFPSHSRPKTVPLHRPLVPQPYFFRHHVTHPGAASLATQLQRHPSEESASYFHTTSKIVAAPGAGSISRPLQQRLQSPVRLPLSLYSKRSSTALSGKLDVTADEVKSSCSGDSSAQANQIGEDSTSTRQRLAGDVCVTVAGIAEGEDSDSSRQASPSSEEIDDSGAIRILMDNNNESSVDIPVTEVEESEGPSTTENQRPRPKLTASNSGADIMLGLETEEGQSAEVEIDTADQEELMPEAEVPKGRVRKASITEKVIKSKASEALAALIKEEAEMRQREFEKLLDEHAELVQEISRTPSSENLIQGERDH